MQEMIELAKRRNDESGIMLFLWILIGVKQGAKKVSFTACHPGKLSLVCSSPRVFLTSPQNFLMGSIDCSSS